MLKLYPSWFVFFVTIIVGVFLVVSGDNWFVVWMGFELSLLGFMPLFSGSSLVIEGMIKYFLCQAGGSSLFLVSFIVFSDFYGVVLFMLGMCMKIGIFPFYQWVPMVMSSLSWEGCLLLSTVQKLPALLVLFLQRNDCFMFMLVSGFMSVICSGVLGYNQNYMRSLMAYSSISHTGWLLCACVVDLSLAVMYLLVYYYLTVVLFLMFSKNNFVKIISGSKNCEDCLFVNLLVLTIAGVPPFSVFFLKVYVVSSLSSFTLVVLFLVVGAMLSIYYYLMFVIPNISSFLVFQGARKMNILKISAFFVSFFFPFLFVL